MWRRFGLAGVLAGCAAPVTPQIRQVSADPPAPVIPHEGYSVVPAELGDRGAMARIHHRTRVYRLTTAVPTNAPEGEVWRSSVPHEDGFDVYPVMGEEPQGLRIVLDDKHAIYAVWIPRGNARMVPVIDVALNDEPGAIVYAGSPIGRDEGRGEREHVTLEDTTLAMDGWIDSRTIGEVWIEHAHPTREATHPLVENTQIRAAPNGRVLATTSDEREVAVIGAPHDGWQQIELADKHARVTGWVPIAAVRADGSLHVGGTGSGFGIGISDTDHLVVPVGTCLFDIAGGEVMGVETVEDDRYAYRPNAEHPGWWRVYLSTPWGAQVAWVHEDKGGLESCKKGR